MEEDIHPFINTKSSKVIFILSIITSIYLFIGWTTNVYSNAFVGAVFEIFWLPAILATVVLPIISLIFLIKEKFNFKSLYLYSIIIIIVAVLTIIMFKL